MSGLRKVTVGCWKCPWCGQVHVPTEDTKIEDLNNDEDTCTNCGAGFERKCVLEFTTKSHRFGVTGE